MKTFCKNIAVGIAFVSLVFPMSCTQKSEKEGKEIKVEIEDKTVISIPNKSFKMDEVFLNRKNGLWQFQKDTIPVSGYIVQYFEDSSLAKKFGVFEGKKEGISTAYYTNGDVKSQEHYKNNRLDGSLKRWSSKPEHKLIAFLQYKKGKLNGEQKKWYDSGELFQISNINMGAEEGMQKAFRKNGKLFINYEARDGKHYGLKRSMLCVELEDEKIVFDE